jgi:hypothetical protein
MLKRKNASCVLKSNTPTTPNTSLAPSSKISNRTLESTFITDPNVDLGMLLFNIHKYMLCVREKPFGPEDAPYYIELLQSSKLRYQTLAIFDASDCNFDDTSSDRLLELKYTIEYLFNPFSPCVEKIKCIVEKNRVANIVPRISTLRSEIFQFLTTHSAELTDQTPKLRKADSADSVANEDIEIAELTHQTASITEIVMTFVPSYVRFYDKTGLNFLSAHADNLSRVAKKVFVNAQNSGQINVLYAQGGQNIILPKAN